MRKEFIFIYAVMFSAFISCKKSTDGNKSVITEEKTETKIVNENGKIDSTTTTSITKEINGKKMGSNSYTYKGLDGSRAKVTFTNNDKSKTITIEANGKKFELDQIGETAKGATYERNGIKAESRGDSVIIMQGTNEIPLVLDK